MEKPPIDETNDEVRTAATEALRWFQARDDNQSAFAVMQMLHAALHPDEPPLTINVGPYEYLDTKLPGEGEWMAAFSDPQGMHFYRGRGQQQWEALLKLHPSPPTYQFATWERQLSLRERIELAHHLGSAPGAPRTWLWAVRQALRVTRLPDNPPFHGI